MKRVFTLFLALLIVAALLVLAACDGNEDDTSSIGGTSDTSDAETEPEFRLPKQDFGGVTVTVLTDKVSETVASVYLASEFAPTDLDDDPVNDAAFNRAKLISEQYGIEIVQETTESMQALVDTLKESVLINEDRYQIVCGALHYLGKLTLDDVYVNLGDIKSNDYIDLSQSYWDQQIVRDLTIDGKTYFVNGDAIVTDDEVTMGVFFNKQLAEDNHLAEGYGAASLFEIVKNGDWTLDVMYEMAAEVAADNGDVGMEWSADSDDIWGINGQLYDASSLLASTGNTMTRIENGVPILTIDEEKNINAFDKIMNIYRDDKVVALAEVNGETFGSGSEDKYDQVVKIMASGKALFTTHYVGTVSNHDIRNANIRYGILPSPKLDQNQEDYISTATVWWCTAMAIPVTNVQNFDATCYAMEALAYYGQQMLTPEYYERTLKNKRLPENDDSPEMLDIIFRNRVYDAGMVYNFGSENADDWSKEMLYFYPEIMRTKINTHISNFESVQDIYQNGMEDFIAAMAE